MSVSLIFLLPIIYTGYFSIKEFFLQLNCNWIEMFQFKQRSEQSSTNDLCTEEGKRQSCFTPVLNFAWDTLLPNALSAG